jgi:hypothetical protein
MTRPPSARALNSADSISRADVAILPALTSLTATHIADPGIDLFATAKRLQDPLVFLKGIDLVYQIYPCFKATAL